jgi:sugar/nucleoside kinase (ribokinase family)
MSKDILVVGSTALDSVETAHGKVDDALGGSAFYFATAASHFAKVALVGVVGGDFDMERLAPLKDRHVDLSGLEIVPDGKTFRWGGRYHENMMGRDTLFTELGVFETFAPQIPKERLKSPILFLANIQPDLQLNVLEQLDGPELVVTDTMNLWINIALDSLEQVISRTNIFILNDEEAAMITGERNPLLAAQALLKRGPKVVIVKKGEHGALLVSADGLFAAPAMPLTRVIDPTGAGDTFAGGFVGSLARESVIDDAALRRAVICGSALASFCVEDFSLNRLFSVSATDLQERLLDFKRLCAFDI